MALLATALVYKAIRLGEAGNGEAAIAVYDEVVRRFADAPEPALQEAVTLARAALAQVQTIAY